MSIGIIGGGVWGSALAKLFSSNQVTIYARDKKVVKSINEHHLNPVLKYVSFNQNVKATASIEGIINNKYIFIALPTQSIRSVLEHDCFKDIKAHIIIASKGIEIETSSFLSTLVEQLTNPLSVNVLSGPSFSDEVAQDLPTAVTFAATNKEVFDQLTSIVKGKNFRMYYSDDIIGSQIGGALKNIYAIAAGISDGLNLGENARSALITRSFVEMARFANFYKAKKETVFGLSGLGDLMLTCNSSKSRNTKFGIQVASTKLNTYEDLLDKNAITEGYYTIKATKKISDTNKIEMPIMNAIYNILYKEHDIKEEIVQLMNRPPVEEKI